MGGDVLSSRAPNRATLARQLLLRRSDLGPLAAVAHLVGMQAHVPHNPYLGLWSRLEGYRPEELSQLLGDRQLVRIVVMRGTLHLVTADDCLVLRPLAQPGARRRPGPPPPVRPGAAGGRHGAGGRGRTLPRPRPPPPWPTPAATCWPSCRCRGDGLWGRSAQVTPTTAEAWLAGPWPPGRRSTAWCCATWPPSGRRRWPTWSPGRA